MGQTLAIIQARTGSSRLPGKVMYPLDGKTTLERVCDRVKCSKSVDTVVVATSTAPQDEVINQLTTRFEATSVCGSESDVLNRFARAVDRFDANTLVRVTADCPLISPAFIDAAVERVTTGDADYVSGSLDRTFPRGLTCEAFSTDSFRRVVAESTAPHHREHVTPYYREHPEQFSLANVNSARVFDEPWLCDRTDLRLTLDEPADYRLIDTVYREVPFEEILPLRDAVSFIDENDLGSINDHVEQKSV